MSRFSGLKVEKEKGLWQQGHPSALTLHFNTLCAKCFAVIFSFLLPFDCLFNGGDISQILFLNLCDYVHISISMA